MTQLKKLKKAVRARSRKTGESYAAARRQVLEARRRRALARGLVRPAPESVARASRPSAAPAAFPKAAPAAAAFAKSGMSEAAIVKKTGKGLDHWFPVLDAFGATEKGHKASARHLNAAHGVPGWHAQGITVAYERRHGLRALNQSCVGSFQVSVSKAVPAPVTEVADLIGSAPRRAAWLADVDPELARALEAAFKGGTPRSVSVRDATYARLRYPWDGKAVELRITGKKGGGSTVVADNTSLPDVSLVEDRRSRWRAALEALRSHLQR